MKVAGKPTRSIWLEFDGWSVGVIDQTALPHRFVTARLTTLAEAAHAISAMVIRGAPLIGATAAYGMALALREDASDEGLRACLRNTPRNPSDRDQSQMGARRDGSCRAQSAAFRARSRRLPPRRRDQRTGYRDQYRHCPQRFAAHRGYRRAKEAGRAGQCAHPLQRRLAGGGRCRHGHRADLPGDDNGLPIYVFADETRPRNQGASLTAWELGQHGVPHTLIADNTGGHLMQHGLVDLVIVGTDRVTANGDVCNKIGTYLKALAARDNNVPFYVALPSPTIDFTVADGIAEIPIEQRGADELATMTGQTADGRIETVRVAPAGTPVANYGFDVTPARLVTGLITERGVIAASRAALAGAFPQRAGAAE